MSGEPLVSVVIPAFNAAPWIDETLRSIIGQTYGRIETIVVDDGSSDDTAAIASRFADKGVRVINQEKAGASIARNTGLSQTRGDYIQFLDADDLLSPNKIESQIRLLKESPTGCIAVCGTVYFHDGEDPSQGFESPGYSELNSDAPLQWLIDLWTPGPGYGTTRWGMVPHHAWLVPKGVTERAGPWNEELTQDQDGEYFTRVILSSTGVRWASEGRAYYRKFVDRVTVSGGVTEAHLLGRLAAVDSKRDHVLPRTTMANRSRASKVLARQYKNVAFHAYPMHPSVAKVAEERAEELGGYEMRFFERTRMRHVEQIFGWKTAKWLSHAYHSLSKL